MGQPIAATKKAALSNVVNLMGALRVGLKFEEGTQRKKPPRNATQDDAPAHLDARQTNDDKITAHSHCHLLFDNRIGAGRAAQSRQQAGGSGKAERADSLQTRWNGPRHKAMGR
jgi:hypothetical protein